jgi:hypothetical protein
MMAAFQALGVGPAPANPATGSTPAATGSTPGVPAAESATGTGATQTSTAAAPDTLEKAVNEFAHALSALLQRQGRAGHSDGEHGEGHRSDAQVRGTSGYNGLAQRLEKLAQSLGGATPAQPSSTPATLAAASAEATSVPNAPVSSAPASTTPAAVTAPSAALPQVLHVPGRQVTRLLAAFTHVLNFLQTGTPTPTATPAPSATSTPPASKVDSVTSVTEKLRLFLTTVAQSLQSGAQGTTLSLIGSRVNISV